MSSARPTAELHSVPRISIETLTAYFNALYLVDRERTTPIELRVGRQSGPLCELHALYRVDESVFVSACNPFGRQQDSEENIKATQELHAWLQEQAFASITGRGVDEAGAWPAEESYLVLGADAALGRVLCVRFGQNAVLHSGAEGIPTLLLHPDAVLC
ncbi:MAG: DUF3293 domain-containing protein [Acidobacteria bacterium]|nr:DUF3293 domain-containing protein [Acidobacteriota bacterium]